MDVNGWMSWVMWSTLWVSRPRSRRANVGLLTFTFNFACFVTVSWALLTALMLKGFFTGLYSRSYWMLSFYNPCPTLFSLQLSHSRYLSTFRNISSLGRKIHMSWTARLWYYKWSLISIWGGLKWWRLDVAALVFHSKSRAMFFFFSQKYWTDSWFNTCAYNDTVGAKALHPPPSYWPGETFIWVPGYW